MPLGCTGAAYLHGDSIHRLVRLLRPDSTSSAKGISIIINTVFFCLKHNTSIDSISIGVYTKDMQIAFECRPRVAIYNFTCTCNCSPHLGAGQ